MNMLTTSLFGLLLAFLLPIGLVTIILGCICKWRENTYAAFFTYGLSNWITFVLLLLFFFPKLGLSLSDVGFKSTITLEEISLALLFTLAGFGWFALMEKLKVLEMRGMDFKIANWKHIVILSFYAPVTAAFCEEFFYRGFAITTLGSILGNFWIAGIISCFAFAFLHLPYFLKIRWMCTNRDLGSFSYDIVHNYW
ncbi:MAG: CPBP family intramembrane metalloprotease [bacterium]|nr:CPBP family intramembrane metalloprotease [bacterium]